MEAIFGSYAAYIVPAYLVSAAVMVVMVAAARLQYRQRLREIEALEQQGVTRRAGRPASKSGSGKTQSAEAGT